MSSLAFIEYATSPDLSRDEIYTVELLIDRVAHTLEGDFSRRSAVRRELRGLPSYIPSFNREDLEAAAGAILDLTWLSFQRNNDNYPPVRSLVPLRFLRKLATLHLTGNEVADLSPLRETFMLRELGLSGNPVSDLRPLTDCSRLEKLTLDESITGNWAVLEHLRALRRLEIPFAAVAKFRTIPLLPSLWFCHITCIGEYVDSLEGFPAMPELRVLESLEVSSLRGIGTYPLLVNLVNFGCRVDSLRPLAALKNLTHANIHGTHVNSVAPFTELLELREIILGSSENIADAGLLARLPRLHKVDIHRDVMENPVSHPALETIRGQLSSWDVEFLAPSPASASPLRMEIVDEETFQFYNTGELYGLRTWQGNKEQLSSEIEWLDARIEAALGKYLKDAKDFTLPFQWPGGRSRTVYIMSIRALRHLPRIIDDIRNALAHFRQEWIIFLQAGEIAMEGAEFEAWVYPDKLVATAENASKLRRFLAPGFRWTGWLYQLRLRR